MSAATFHADNESITFTLSDNSRFKTHTFKGDSIYSVKTSYVYQFTPTQLLEMGFPPHEPLHVMGKLHHICVEPDDDRVVNIWLKSEEEAKALRRAIRVFWRKAVKN
jgi:hypothetical protein